MKIVLFFLALYLIYKGIMFNHKNKVKDFKDFFDAMPYEPKLNILKHSYALTIELQDHLRIVKSHPKDCKKILSHLEKFTKTISKIIYGLEVYYQIDNRIIIFWESAHKTTVSHTIDLILKEIDNFSSNLSIDGIYPLKLHLSLSFTDRYTTFSTLIDSCNSLEHYARKYKILMVSDSASLSNAFITPKLETNIYACFNSNSGSNKVSEKQHEKMMQAIDDRRHDMVVTIAESLRTSWDKKLFYYYNDIIHKHKKLSKKH